MKPIIEVQSISKKYRIYRNRPAYQTLRDSLRSLLRGGADAETLWALRDITVQVMEGEVLGVIGENGAGKTTLLKILSQITPPSMGRAIIRGRVASLLEVGTGFHHELTGRENIFLNGSILGLTAKEIRKRLNEILAFAEVEDFVDTPLKYYSTGMSARLAFSVAAHLDPDILLVDEVLSVGDAEFQRKSLGRMTDLARGGRTVLFVSHNMPAVRRLCSRCILLRHGRVCEEGRPDEVIDAYLPTQTRHENGVAIFPGSYPRTGSQKVRLTSIELRNQDDAITGVYGIGDRLGIHLHLTAETNVRSVKVVLEILESDGGKVATIYDSDSSFALRSVSGAVHLSVTLCDLRFYPGSYAIGVEILSEIAGWQYDLYDQLPSCITFRMVNNLVSHRTLHRKDGLLYLTPQWRRHAA